MKIGSLTQTLGSSSLQQVVDGGTDNHPLAARVDSKTTDLDAMLTGDVLDQRRLTNNLDELLAGVTLLVDVADVTRGHLLLEGHADGVLEES